MIVFRCYYYEIRYNGNQWSQPNSIHFHPLIISHTYTHTVIYSEKSLAPHKFTSSCHRFCWSGFFLFLFHQWFLVESSLFRHLFSRFACYTDIGICGLNVHKVDSIHSQNTEKSTSDQSQSKYQMAQIWIGLVYDLCIKPWLRITCR